MESSELTPQQIELLKQRLLSERKRIFDKGAAHVADAVGVEPRLADEMDEASRDQEQSLSLQLADNDRMLHRTQELGPPEARLPHDLLRDSAQLNAADEGGWEIRDGGVQLWRYPAEQLRISILWKAHALADAEEARVIDSGSDDLDPQRIEAVFARHASEHGMILPPTEDPRTDSEGISAVAALPPL